jgi:ABC-type polysaccharide/polyol phosphate export permease
VSSVLAEELMPDASLRYRRRLGPIRAAKELWAARELVRTLAERDLRARYKQAALGVAWAVITPLALMVVFTLIVQRVGKIDTGGAPYPLFAYLGLLPWTFFSTSVSIGGMSLVTNQTLVNKVHCPREVFPLASVAVAAVDAVIGVAVLCVLFVVMTFVPKPTTVWVPVLIVPLVAFTVGITMLISAAVVYMRDLRHVLPIILQIGLFLTPVAYGMAVIPAQYRQLYSALNPIAPVIDGLRRTVLVGLPPDWRLFIPGLVMSIVVLVLGYLLFKKLETGFADVA